MPLICFIRVLINQGLQY